MARSTQEPAHHRKGKGKENVRMVEMENKRTFSKRRHRLFKKASELCTLTGSEIGLIMFSPEGKVYSFGNPSIHEIINKSSLEACDGDSTKRSIETLRSDEPKQSVSVAVMNLRLSIVEMQLEDAERRIPTVEEREKAELEGHMGIEGIMEGELVELGRRLNTLKENLERMDKSQAMPSPMTSLHPNPW